MDGQDMEDEGKGTKKKEKLATKSTKGMNHGFHGARMSLGVGFTAENSYIKNARFSVVNPTATHASLHPCLSV